MHFGGCWRKFVHIRENTENEILPRLTEDQRNITPFSLKSQPILKLNTAVYNEFKPAWGGGEGCIENVNHSYRGGARDEGDPIITTL